MKLRIVYTNGEVRHVRIDDIIIGEFSFQFAYGKEIHELEYKDLKEVTLDNKLIHKSVNIENIFKM